VHCISKSVATCCHVVFYLGKFNNLPQIIVGKGLC